MPKTSLTHHLGVVSQGPGNVWKAGTTLIYQEITAKVTEVPEEERQRQQSQEGGDERETSPKDRVRSRDKELLQFTHAQHHCLLGGSLADKGTKRLDMKKCE